MRVYMEREEIKTVANKLIEDAKTLLADAKRNGDYDECSIYDEQGNIKQKFLEKDRKVVIDKIMQTINSMDESEKDYLTHDITFVVSNADREMRKTGGWQNPVATDKMAGMLLLGIIYKKRFLDPVANDGSLSIN